MSELVNEQRQLLTDARIEYIQHGKTEYYKKATKLEEPYLESLEPLVEESMDLHPVSQKSMVDRLIEAEGTARKAPLLEAIKPPTVMSYAGYALGAGAVIAAASGFAAETGIDALDYPIGYTAGAYMFSGLFSGLLRQLNSGLAESFNNIQWLDGGRCTPMEQLQGLLVVENLLIHEAAKSHRHERYLRVGLTIALTALQEVSKGIH